VQTPDSTGTLQDTGNGAEAGEQNSDAAI